MLLQLGVLDVPYTTGGDSAEVRFTTKKGKAVRFSARTKQVTTGDVAEWLEKKYHVMEIFYELRAQAIADDIARSLQDVLEDALSGAPVTALNLQGTESFIKTEFAKFIDSKEMDGLGYPGVPTAASLAGVNHRMKDPYAPRPPRPSFRDTGTYEDSFIAALKPNA